MFWGIVIYKQIHLLNLFFQKNRNASASKDFACWHFNETNKKRKRKKERKKERKKVV